MVERTSFLSLINSHHFQNIIVFICKGFLPDKSFRLTWLLPNSNNDIDNPANYTNVLS